jgi:hypothetical protein
MKRAFSNNETSSTRQPRITIIARANSAAEQPAPKFGQLRAVALGCAIMISGTCSAATSLDMGARFSMGNFTNEKHLSADSVEPSALEGTSLDTLHGTIYEATRLNTKKLQLENSIQYGERNVSRFQQYHLGVPVWQQSVIVETNGNPFESVVEKISGNIIEGLEKDIPEIKVALLEDAALAAARRHFGIQTSSDEQIHLYVALGRGGLAQLVYLVSFNSEANGAKVRPAFMVSATTGDVLQQWDSTDDADGFGPGDFLRPAVESLLDSGWSKDRIETLLVYAQGIYLLDGTSMAATQCGAVQAAADLGYDIAEVKLAFTNPGTCRSNVRKSRIDNSDEQVPTINSPTINSGQNTKITAKSSSVILPPQYTAWRNMNRTDILSLASWDTPDKLRAAFRSVLEVPGKPLPSNVRVTAAYINDFHGAEGSGTFQSNSTTCGAYCVRIRTAQTGARLFSSSFTPWTAVPGYDVRVKPNNTNGTLSVAGDTVWSSAVAVQTAWSFTTSASVKIGTTVKLIDAASVSFEVTLGISATKSGSRTTTITQNFSHPTVRVPKGCELVIQLQNRWQLETDSYDVRPQIQGTLRGASYPTYNNNEYHSRDASGVFAKLPNEPAYKVTNNNRKTLEIRAEYWGRVKGTNTLCTLLP